MDSATGLATGTDSAIGVATGAAARSSSVILNASTTAWSASGGVVAAGGVGATGVVGTVGVGAGPSGVLKP